MILEWLVLLCFVVGAFSFGLDVLAYILIGFMSAFTLVMVSELKWGGTFLDLGFASFSWSRGKSKEVDGEWIDYVPERVEIRMYYGRNKMKVWVLREGDVEYAREMKKRREWEMYD